MSESVRDQWWGRFEFDHSQWRLWQIGPLRLYVCRTDHAWLIKRETHDDETPTRVLVNAPVTDVSAIDALETETFFDASGCQVLVVKPLTADRTVVSKPREPFCLLGGESATVFVGTPLWLSMRIESSEQEFLNFPILKPSDTWFGADTIRGELCYGSKTHARFNLAELPIRPHRAFSAITIKNHSDSTFQIDKLALPVKYLNLYGDKVGRFWTEDLSLVRDRDGEFSSIERSRGIPACAAKALKISDAREASHLSVLTRMYSSIFVKG